MLMVFNAFQIVAGFVAWPFLIAWLSTAEFKGSTPALIAACALYVVAFWMMTAMVADTLDHERKR